MEEKNKIVNRAFLDEEDDHWKMRPITRIEEYVQMNYAVVVRHAHGQICVQNML